MTWRSGPTVSWFESSLSTDRFLSGGLAAVVPIAEEDNDRRTTGPLIGLSRRVSFYDKQIEKRDRILAQVNLIW